MTGSQVYTLFRAFIDQQWVTDGLFKYIEEPTFRAILKAVPRRNKRELLGNMLTYAKTRVSEAIYD